MSDKSSGPDPDPDATRPFNRPDAGGSRGGSDQGPDATAPYEPVDDEATARYERLNDPTAPYDAVGGDEDPDATRRFDKPDTTAAAGGAAAGATDPDATQVADAWTGRAEVRGPTPPEDGDGWDEQGNEEPGRRWWLPILIGVVAVLLVIAGITAAFILSNNDKEPTPVPSITATPGAPSPSPASPSPVPTSAAPTSASPTVGTTVVVPTTAGDSQETATNKLEALGLTVHVTTQEDPVAQPGTVLGTVPQAGAVVPAGSDIAIIVAKAMPGSPSPSHEPPQESLSPQAKPSGD